MATATQKPVTQARATQHIVHGGRPPIPPGAKVTRGEELPDYAFDSALEHGLLTDIEKDAKTAEQREALRQKVVARQQAGRSVQGKKDSELSEGQQDALEQAAAEAGVDDEEFVEVPD